MKESDRIISEYRESDPEEQLHLFLDNPTLRTDFIEIELDAERPNGRDSTPTERP